jgi:SAM-dependent methyltransferase
MSKKYATNAWLQSQDNRLYTIFPWGQKKAEIITAKSWLAVLEIFIHEHSLEKAYEIFQAQKLDNILDEVKKEVSKYDSLIDNAVILLGGDKLTIFGRGFRSFIEKDMEFELGYLSKKTYQVVTELFTNCQLDDDLKSIENIDDFRQIVISLENLGLLSPAKGSIDWGDLKRPVPICQAFGLTRGTFIDRYYLSKFIKEIQSQVSGNILEIGGTPKDKDFYQINPGSSYQILNMEAGPGVDIVGDAHDISMVKPESFDSIILFNVLEHCYAPWIVVENIYAWLKPGGKCFAMVPTAIRLHATPMDYWRPLPDAFRYMFRNYSQQQLYVYGNPTTVIGSYYGIAAEELTADELDIFHPDYPVATCIVAQK